MIVHSLFKRGAIWFVDFRFEGRRYRVSTHSRTKADAQVLAEHIVRATVERAMGGARFNLSTLMDRYVSHIRAANSPSWYSMKRTYLRRFAKFVGDRPLSEVTPYDCQQYQQRVVHSGVTKSSVNGQMAAIRHMFSMAVEWEMMDRNPMAKVRKFPVTGRQRLLSDEEIRAILGAALAMSEGARTVTRRTFYHFIKLLTLTGMRRGEAAKLRWADFRGDFISVPYPKERKPKLVPIPPKFKVELLTLNQGQEYVFQGIGREAIRNAWIAVCKRAGVKDAHIHDLRHHFSTVWARSGTSLVALQRTLGHSSLTMTARYAHANDQDQLDAVTRLEAELGGATVGPRKRHKKR